MIFDKYLELGTIASLRAYLNEKGFRTKSYTSKRRNQVGGKLFSDSSLYNMLINRTYIGVREINKRARYSEQDTLAPDDRYRFAKAVWPAIITDELFKKVQEKMARNGGEARKRGRVYLLSGKAMCTECGEPLIGVGGTGESGKSYYYYGHKRKFIISNDRHLKRCALERVHTDRLEQAVFARIKTLSKDKALVRQLVSQSKTSAKDLGPELDELAKLRGDELRKNNEMIRNLTDRMGV